VKFTLNSLITSKRFTIPSAFTALGYLSPIDFERSLTSQPEPKI
jgi:hypothetical protein